MLKNSEFWKPITDNIKVSGAPKNTTSQQIPSLSSDECDNSVLKSEDEKIQQDRLKVFIEDVADGYYEVDLQGNFIFFNDAMCRIFGYPSHEIKERNYREFMDKENADIAFEAFNKIYRTDKGVTDINWVITRKDGEQRHLEISANLITTEDGEKKGFRGIARDVTDRHLAEEALKESEQCALDLSRVSRRAEKRFRSLLEFLPDPVFAFNLDSTVRYLNPAFERVFGWTLKELEGKIIPFVPDSHKEQTSKGVERLFKEKIISGFETKRLTRDGRLLDIIVDGALFYDEDDEPAGQVITLRDVTAEKRNARINQALFRIARALLQYRGLDQRLEIITKEVQALLEIEGAMVILVDEENREFFFREAAFDDSETGEMFKELRFPLDAGIAGLVYRTGKPQIVEDVYKDPHFLPEVDQQARYRSRNMLDVPIYIQDRMIGVLCAVNKKDGRFEKKDVELLSTIANLVALPIENASINDALQASYDNVRSLNRAKDRVIHHLSHELKTPASVLSATLGLLDKRFSQLQDDSQKKILERAQRNLDRILDMQYEIEDILREKDYKIYYMLSNLLAACTDELEVLVTEHLGEKEIIQRIRQKIEDLFGVNEAESEKIQLDAFVTQKVQALRPRFSHRKIRLETDIVSVPAIWLPVDALDKIVEGLIRNAIENTPDDGNILVTVRTGEIGPELEVKDNGVGISEENQRLIFDNYFIAYEPMQYSTRQPYDFNAGGKGFDLLRMKFFSEKYDFNLKMFSEPCRLAGPDSGICPGHIDDCEPAKSPQDCEASGGTSMTVQFHPADRVLMTETAAQTETAPD
jgi:PAS domain S-box-containing protein